MSARFEDSVQDMERWSLEDNSRPTFKFMVNYHRTIPRYFGLVLPSIVFETKHYRGIDCKVDICLHPRDAIKFAKKAAGSTAVFINVFNGGVYPKRDGGELYHSRQNATDDEIFDYFSYKNCCGAIHLHATNDERVNHTLLFMVSPTEPGTNPYQILGVEGYDRFYGNISNSLECVAGIGSTLKLAHNPSWQFCTDSVQHFVSHINGFNGLSCRFPTNEEILALDRKKLRLATIGTEKGGLTIRPGRTYGLLNPPFHFLRNITLFDFCRPVLLEKAGSECCLINFQDERSGGEIKGIHLYQLSREEFHKAVLDIFEIVPAIKKLLE